MVAVVDSNLDVVGREVEVTGDGGDDLVAGEIEFVCSLWQRSRLGWCFIVSRVWFRLSIISTFAAYSIKVRRICSPFSS